MASDLSSDRDPRVFLAIERTSLAWTRTALALMGFGFVVARLGVFLRELAATQPGVQIQLHPPLSQSLWLGIGLVVLGVVVQGLALLEHQRQVRRYLTGEVIGPRGWSLSALAGTLLVTMGIAIAAYLMRYL